MIWNRKLHPRFKKIIKNNEKNKRKINSNISELIFILFIVDLDVFFFYNFTFGHVDRIILCEWPFFSLCSWFTLFFCIHFIDFFLWSRVIFKLFGQIIYIIKNFRIVNYFSFRIVCYKVWLRVFWKFKADCPGIRYICMLCHWWDKFLR